MSAPGTLATSTGPIRRYCYHVPHLPLCGQTTPRQNMRFSPSCRTSAPNRPARLLGWVLLGGILLTASPVLAQSISMHRWNVDGGGLWSKPNNWLPVGIPDSSDAVAQLGGAITSPQTILLLNSITVARLEFDNENSYALVGTGGLLFDSTVENAAVEVDRGAHQLQIPVDLLGDLELDLAFGSALILNASLNLNGHTMQKTRAGELQINSGQAGTGTLSATRGIVSGLGNIGGDLFNTSATVAPGPGFGQLSVSGNYVQGSTAVLQIELGGIGAGLFDVLDIAQSASLSGTLEVAPNGNIPTRGERFAILNYAQRSGTFDTIQGLEIGPTLQMVPQYGPSDLTLMTAELDFWISPGGDWQDESNWQSGEVPEFTTLAVIDNGGLADVSMPTQPIAGLDIRKGAINVQFDGALAVDGTTHIRPGGILGIFGTAATEQFTTNTLEVEGVFDVNEGGIATVSNDLIAAPGSTVVVGPSSFVNVLGTLRNTNTEIETLAQGAYHLSGVLAYRDARILTNQATLVLNGTQAAIEDLAGANALSDLANNAASGNLKLINHSLGVSFDFTNAGNLSIENSSFSAAGTFIQTSGLTSLNGGTLATTSVDIRGGQLSGQGTIIGVLLNGADVSPGLDGAGILQVQGGYIQTVDGRLEIEIAGLGEGTEHDQLDVFGGAPVQLGGLLDLRLGDGFQPQFFQQFQIIRGNVTTPFDAFLFPDSQGGLAVDLIYGRSGVTVAFAQPTQEIYDSPPEGGLWSAAGSWRGSVPTSLDVVDITKTVSGSQTLNVDVNSFVHQASISTELGLNDPLTLNIPDGISWSATSDVNVGTNANIKVGGTDPNEVVEAQFYAGGDLRIGGTMNSQFIQADGVVKIGGDLVLAEAGGTGVYSLTGGTLDMDNGSILIGFGNPIFDFSGGRLTNVKNVISDDPEDANLVQTGGTLAPGNSPGSTTIAGDYTIMSAGTLEIEVEGMTPGQFDELLVGGTATLDGTLDIQLEGTYDPSVGDMIAVLTASNISGVFSSITTAMDDDTIMVPIYTETSLFLCGSTVGDMDVDCDVDMDDIDEFVLALNDPIAYILQEGMSGEALGDFDNDNDLDFDDVDGFAVALGGGMSVQQILNWVPEPGGLTMWMIACLVCCAFRTHSRPSRS